MSLETRPLSWCSPASHFLSFKSRTRHSLPTLMTASAHAQYWPSDPAHPKATTYWFGIQPCLFSLSPPPFVPTSPHLVFSTSFASFPRWRRLEPSSLFFYPISSILLSFAWWNFCSVCVHGGTALIVCFRSFSHNPLRFFSVRPVALWDDSFFYIMRW